MPTSQRIVQVCLYLLAAICLFGGTLQVSLGQPETSPRLDNVHRFLGAVYFSVGVIGLWAAWTVREQGTLIYLLAFGILMGAIGRLISMSKVGLPEPGPLWLTYLGSELVLPIIMAAAHWASTHRVAAAAT